LSSPERFRGMSDLTYVMLTLLFFAAAFAYIAGCDRLK
jgi:hypothetical protein